MPDLYKYSKSESLELLFFGYFLRMPASLLRAWIQLYNEDLICQEARTALEAIEQMSG